MDEKPRCRKSDGCPKASWSSCRGRDADYSTPPAQIRTSALTHTALTEDAGRQAKSCSLPHTAQSLGHAFPALCRVHVRWNDVLLSLRPSLPNLRGRWPFVVRLVHRCRVGGGALACWPPSAAQTVRAVFPHTAFTKTHSSGMSKKESIEPSSQARTLRTTWSRAVVSSQCFAIAENDAPGCDAQSNR